VTQFDDITKMTSHLISLTFYCTIINLNDNELAKLRKFESPRRKNQNYPVF